MSTNPNYAVMPFEDYQSACDAIRVKTGKTDLIKSGDMAVEIEGIQNGGSEPVIESLTITENGTYEAPDGVDGYSPVTVNVEATGGDTSVEDALITRTITEYSNDRVKEIGKYAFGYCSSLTTADLPTCTSIGSFAFYSCTSLVSVNLPTCTSIGSFAFYYCTNLASVDLPTCTSIGNDVFYYCANLVSMDLPECTSIGNSVFCSCTSLVSVNLPTCTSIGSYAFSRCTNLASVDLPECTRIGSYVFYNCTNLVSVSLPMCSTIITRTFANCSKLPSMNLPTCTRIYSSAFTGCTSLSSVTLGASTVCTLSNINAFNNTLMSTTGWFYVPQSLIASYQNAANWSYFSSRFSAIESLGTGGDSTELITYLEPTEYTSDDDGFIMLDDKWPANYNTDYTWYVSIDGSLHEITSNDGSLLMGVDELTIQNNILFGWIYFEYNKTYMIGLYYKE